MAHLSSSERLPFTDGGGFSLDRDARSKIHASTEPERLPLAERSRSR